MKKLILLPILLILAQLSSAQESKFETLLNSNSKDCELYYNVAIDLFNNSKKAEAIQCFGKAYTVKNINVSDVDKYYALYLLHIGNYDQAIEKYQNAVLNGFTFKADDYNNLSICYLKMNNIAEAANNIKVALSLDEHNIKYMGTLMNIYEAVYDWKKINDISKKILILDSENEKALTFYKKSEIELMNTPTNSTAKL